MKPLNLFADPRIAAHYRLHRLLTRLMLLHDRDPGLVEQRLERNSPMSGEQFSVMATAMVERRRTVKTAGGNVYYEPYSRPEEVCDRGDFYTCMVRKQGREIGLKEKRFQLYTVDELNAMSRHVVGKIASTGIKDPSTKSIAPWYPNGWQTAMRDVCDEDVSLPANDVMADAGAL